MRCYGFSTGALGKSDFLKALNVSKSLGLKAIEYSALRADELRPLVAWLLSHGTEDFEYVSLHAPSKFARHEEATVLALLRQVTQVWKINIVVHPDCIFAYDQWRDFGDQLCVENMDERKPIGRTADELEAVFTKLPEARLCFDIGHAHEVDRSMVEGYEILRRFGNRLAQVHASEVSDRCVHRPFSYSSTSAFLKIAGMIPVASPIILETTLEVSSDHSRLRQQLEIAQQIFPSADLREVAMAG